tara:strand:- start:384 stop:575 length:192 start_codon:yes stop_codon:yes gene_type:complete
MLQLAAHCVAAFPARIGGQSLSAILTELFQRIAHDRLLFLTRLINRASGGKTWCFSVTGLLAM